MKKLIFTLVLMLTGAFAFANGENSTSLSESEINSSINFSENIEIIKVSVVEDNLPCPVYHSVYYDGELVGEFTTEEPDDSDNCHGVVLHMLKKVE